MSQNSVHRPMPDMNAWPAFTLPWDDNTPGPTDMSYLLDTPAGANGFVKIVDGHLAGGDGKRLRFWGQSFEDTKPMPPMDLAPIIARRLAKFGINSIRLHALDNPWPRGLLMRATESTRALDPEAMARLDWFIHCCKQLGIYMDLNLHCYRQFSAADGVKQPETTGCGKPITYWDDWMISLQKEFAGQLITHANPFTGHRYGDEPAIAIIEMTNENSVSEQWVNGWLRGENTKKRRNWGDMPQAYAQDLDGLWNAWLSRKYRSRDELAEAWGKDLAESEDASKGSVHRLRPEGFAAASAGRFRDEAEFLNGIEKDFFAEMKSYIRGELGAQQLLLGSSDHNRSWSGLPMIAANAVLDVTDNHFYWQHPIFPTDDWGPGPRPEYPTLVGNTPMVDEPDHAMIGHLSRGMVAGHPHIISEVNEPAPNDAAAEFIPIIASYGRLQDWDGIMFYNYQSWGRPFWREEPWADQRVASWFDMANDPIKMAQTAIGALIFLRGDVQAAKQTVERYIPHEWLLDSVRMRNEELRPYWLPYLPGRLALVHGTRVASLEAENLAPAEGEVRLPTGSIVSDTGELTWEDTPGDGRVLIDTPRHQVIIGRAGKRSTTNLTLDLTTPFAAVEIASHDEKPLGQTDRILLLAATRATNTDFQWADDTRQPVKDWGHAPTRIEPVVATLTLHGVEGAKSVLLQPLDGHGQAAGDPAPFSMKDGDFSMHLSGDRATPWYLIEVMR